MNGLSTDTLSPVEKTLLIPPTACSGSSPSRRSGRCCGAYPSPSQAGSSSSARTPRSRLNARLMSWWPTPARTGVWVVRYRFSRVPGVTGGLHRAMETGEG